jgi:hypothetical protein
MHTKTAAKSIVAATFCAVVVISYGRAALDAHAEYGMELSVPMVQEIPGEQVSLFSSPQR